MKKISLSFCTVILGCASACFFVLPRAHGQAADAALSKVLVEGKGWELVSEGHAFTDALCSDAAGNFYFADVSKGTNIFKIDTAGKVSTAATNAPRISGLKFGPDGRLYGCQGSTKRILAFDLRSGTQEIIATNVQPNDLVVTRKGQVYFTETGPQQVTLVEPNGQVRAVDKGINKPNGLTLSPDESTLVVSDYGGSNLWSFRIEASGSLTAKTALATVKLPMDKDNAASDGMTTDIEGRYYVTSTLGVQIFESNGKLMGVIPKPVEKGMVSVTFAGQNRSYLYVACSDKIFRRPTQTRGAPLAR